MYNHSCVKQMSLLRNFIYGVQIANSAYLAPHMILPAPLPWEDGTANEQSSIALSALTHCKQCSIRHNHATSIVHDTLRQNYIIMYYGVQFQAWAIYIYIYTHVYIYIYTDYKALLELKLPNLSASRSTVPHEDKLHPVDILQREGTSVM